MEIRRLFTKPDQSVFESCNYKKCSCIIKSADGSIISQILDIMMPEHWSQNACDIFAHKYLRKAGVANEFEHVQEDGVPPWLERRTPKSATAKNMGGETHIKDAISRVAGCWAYHGWKNKYFSTEEDAKAFFDEICYMLLHQICSPNSPQWFNTGLYWAYGIAGNPAGHFHLKNNEIIRSNSAYEHPQVHACFILPVEDHLLGKEGIMDTWCSEAAIFKYGSGAGANFSKLRGEGEVLSGGGKSSGLMSFLRIGDTAAGAIKSGGTTRRAAKMVILDDDHPDIEKFVNWKLKEEQKVLAMVVGYEKTKKHVEKLKEAFKKGGSVDNYYLKMAVQSAEKDGIASNYINQIICALEQNIDINLVDLTYDWNGQAYGTVSGQNSNNSVRITDKLLAAIQNDQDWELKGRVDGKTMKTIKARSLWDQICYSAWACADPGVQYEDIIQHYHTCKASGKIRATNPCSEYVFLDNTACNLASINLDKMLGKEGFKVVEFKHAVRLLTIALDISVQMAQYPTYEFAKQSLAFRTLGLGYASLGSMLMQYGFPYDSDRGRNIASAVTALLTWVSYETSAEIAKELGVFSQFELNKKHIYQVLDDMLEATNGNGQNFNDYDNCVGFEFLDKLNQANGSKIHVALGESELADDARKAAKIAMEKIKKYGLRNAQTTCIAPTGTISFIMDCGSTSCEPSFSLVSWKKLAGGGDMKVLNPQVEKALMILGYDKKQQTDIKHHVFGHGNLHKAPEINNQTLFDIGVDIQVIERINSNLPASYHISHAFNQEGLNLEKLGFTQQQIQQANLHVCGHLTIEGAPDLDSIDEDIFSCAVNNGTGVKFISPMGHVKMLAAIQPFISGASSKTVNMPESATVKDISNIYLSAWALGVKCIAIYRNNSKFSQALNTTNFVSQISVNQGVCARIGLRLGDRAFYILTQENADGRLIELEIVMGKEGSAFRTLMDCFAKAISIGLRRGVPLSKYIDAFKNTSFEPFGLVTGYEGINKALSPLDLLARVLEKQYLRKEHDIQAVEMLELGQKCKSKRKSIQLQGHNFTLHTGETEDGQLGEVFFKMSKEGSDFCSLMSSFAKAISIALVYGVEFDELYNEFIETKFEPYGFIKHLDNFSNEIKSATSVIDFAFKQLALWYKSELVLGALGAHIASTPFDVKPNVNFDVDSKENEHKIEREQVQINIVATDCMKFASKACTSCDSFDLKVNGSCYVCANCGETTGCS